MKIKQRIYYLRDEINKHNHRYYVLDKPIITDFEFDILLKELESLEKENPQYYDSNSPTNRVGGDSLESFNSFNHKYPMLSLGNTYSNDDLIDFNIYIFTITPFLYVNYQLFFLTRSIRHAIQKKKEKFND